MSVSWKYFVLKPDKTPYPNCEECRGADATHDRETCPHLTCHGFYAATDSEATMKMMISRYPDSRWAVRTGRASGIIVLDAEGELQPQGVTGVDVLDQFEQWTGGLALPTTNLIASTPSGGVHRYYRYVEGIRSRNRILPGVDVKSDGGYVLTPMPGGEGERDWYLAGEPGDLGEAVVDWLTQRRGTSGGGGGGSTGHADGYDYDRFLAKGCPGGVRDEFFNELIFRLRKAGLGRDEVVMKVREHWKRAAQPPDARFYMPWGHVEYKIERIWRTVEPDTVPADLVAWARTAIVRDADGWGRVGRVTVAPRVSE